MADAPQVIRRRVRERYGREARAPAGSTACCGTGYTPDELAALPRQALLSLGSGLPIRHARLRAGEVVLDLGSGAGIDAFLAAAAVGPGGRVIGVDMTAEMLARARRAAADGGYPNVEFREGIIEDLPVEDSSVDVVVSNCVINLSPDKPLVFREAFRVLRPGGRMIISDVVQEYPLGMADDGCGCVATAMLRADYIKTIEAAGFVGIKVLEDRPWAAGPRGVAASSLTLAAAKPAD